MWVTLLSDPKVEVALYAVVVMMKALQKQAIQKLWQELDILVYFLEQPQQTQAKHARQKVQGGLRVLGVVGGVLLLNKAVSPPCSSARIKPAAQPSVR